MTTIDKIRAEIERLMDEYKPVASVDELTGAHIALAKLHSFLDTLEEPVSEDLEEAAEKHASEPISGFIDMTAYRAFIAGAGWMAKQQPLPEDSVAFQKGVQEGKRLMMEGAVEGEVCILPGYVAYVKEKNNESLKQYLLDNFKAGDKVHIIIVKEGEQ